MQNDQNPQCFDLTGHHDGCGLTERCRVVVCDEPHPVNGAHHRYSLLRELTPEESEALWQAEGCEGERRELENCGRIQFQRGPRNEADSTPGTLDGAVLQVLIHRFRCFQAGPFSYDFNAEVLARLEEVQRLMIARAQERAKRGVLGKNEK